MTQPKTPQAAGVDDKKERASEKLVVRPIHARTTPKPKRQKKKLAKDGNIGESEYSPGTEGLEKPGDKDDREEQIANRAMEEEASEGTSEGVKQNGPSSITETKGPSMTSQESKWWAMSFDDLYQLVKSQGFSKEDKNGRKSGRIKMIKWLCKQAGITPYVAPSVPAAETTAVIASPVVRRTGAVSHPEAILRTTDPVLQGMIDEEEAKYATWRANDLLELAMERSYQLLKDSHGKLPSKSIKAMSNWLASWDVLKSDREKKWWLGDGIDLVNKAKAMGYQGSSKKYDVIVWLRSTPEESEEYVIKVAEPTSNKRKAKERARPESNRPANGTKRPRGWDKRG
jgi:hypothetical protein